MNIFKITGITFVAMFALTTALGAFYTIEDGQVGVVSTWGKYSDSESTAGLHWKLPFVQTVHKEDIKLHTVNYKHTGMAEAVNDGVGVVSMPAISILDAKNLPIRYELSVQYAPDGNEMSTILRTFGPNYFEKKLNPIIRSSVRDVASGYEAEDAAKKREEIGTQIELALTKEFEVLPFTLSSIQLRHIVLPPTVAQKIREVQEAKQEEQRLVQAEKQEIVNKRIAIIAAKKAAAEKVIAAEAKATALLKVANAEAKAIKVKGDSLKRNPEVIQLNAVERWDGILPKFTGGGAVPFINVDAQTK